MSKQRIERHFNADGYYQIPKAFLGTWPCDCQQHESPSIGGCSQCDIDLGPDYEIVDIFRWDSLNTRHLMERCRLLGHTVIDKRFCERKEISMDMKQIDQKITSHRDLVLTVVGLLAIDHFVFDGKFKKVLKKVISGTISEVVDAFKSETT